MRGRSTLPEESLKSLLTDMFSHSRRKSAGSCVFNCRQAQHKMKSVGISSFDPLRIIPCCRLSKLPPMVARAYSRAQDTDRSHAVLLDR
ncbi:hypothetical protein KC360_g217 [Hortaea werneckii]|nr:hypothetical protein KC344_g221 [Hortaea werneckii]KAI7180421.1 hypothetical protein KC360_g217 [Hortaea werneckii]